MNFNFPRNIDCYGVVGNPIAQSKSPQIHSAFARQTQQDIYYSAYLLEQEEFAASLEAFQQQGGRGLNVTVPFKIDAFNAVSSHTHRAQIAGAVNTIWFDSDGRSHGDNTDGLGLIKDLKTNGITLREKKVLILGAGGAVRGVLAALLDEDVAHLSIVNRTLSKADELVELISDQGAVDAYSFDTLAEDLEIDVLINGTSASLQGIVPPLPDRLVENVCCYDMVYADQETVFLHWARQNGAKMRLDGLGMLVEQAAEAFHIWRGVRPDTAEVLTALRADLTN